MTITDTIADVTVRIGFGVDAVGGLYFVLDDPVKGLLDSAIYLLAPDTVFTNVADHVAAIEIVRGRDREIDEYSTGTATIVFNDDDRTFDPAYSGSPYAGELVPMKRVLIAWRNISLFEGWADDWAVTYDQSDKVSRVVLECVDCLGILANQELDEIASSFSGDLAGERISRVLDRSEIMFPADRAIDDGNSILGATTLGGNALAYVQACTRAEAGYLFAAADGTLTFRNRTATLNIAGSGITLSDDPATGIVYEEILQRSSADLLYTRVTGQSETTANPLSATNTPAANEFLIRTLALGTLFTNSDVQTQNLINYFLNRFSDVELRFQSAKFNAAALTDDEWMSLVDLELTDLVTVERSPLDVGSAIERFSMIDGIQHRMTPGSWTAEFNFANATTRTFFMLDHATFGVLDSNRLAF